MTDHSEIFDRPATRHEWDDHATETDASGPLRGVAMLAGRLATDGAVAVIAVLGLGALLGVGFQTALMFCLAGLLVAGAFAIASGG